ncbi:universal stress protein [Desulfomonile tiedjei]|uniref:Uncharacterized protein n=1 Tax=Desulfomonile tiedjei (strain ATCC 49306 / DSM 6799 / DCB-1) TaxID=706587 RepID=I4C1J5_DESTA|nr:universal stress protein [Desulfomonile tiedjei]AFM23436.1 hypothetical protein Desti_0710 [Desulfomonile tiedjei DSM 6799]
MKRMKKKLEKMLNAITFAEAGEHETALEYFDNEDSAQSARAPEQESLECKPNEDLIDQAETHWAAAAFAEAGEFDTALEIVPASTPSKAVLLVLDDPENGSDAFDYAVNLCLRMKASLEVLALIDDNGSADINAYEIMNLRCAKQYGISCTVSVLSRNSQTDLVTYVQKHKGIVTIIDSCRHKRKKKSNRPGLLRTLEMIVEKFSIPLVQVSQTSGSKSLRNLPAQ